MPRIGKPDLKERLLEAGLRCFARKGYHATTLDEIAAEAEVTKGAVYWHYRDKSQLFQCVVAERADVLVTQLYQALEGETDPCGQLRAMLNAAFAFYDANPEFATLLGILRSGPEAGLEPCATDELRAFYRHARAQIGQIIQTGIEQGIFAPGPPEILAGGLLAIIDGYILQWVVDPEQIDLRATTPLLVERALQSLR